MRLVGSMRKGLGWVGDGRVFSVERGNVARVGEYRVRGTGISE